LAAFEMQFSGLFGKGGHCHYRDVITQRFRMSKVTNYQWGDLPAKPQFGELNQPGKRLGSCRGLLAELGCSLKQQDRIGVDFAYFRRSLVPAARNGCRSSRHVG
jgi:hypothetical protein